MRERQGMSDSLNQELSQRLQGGSCNFGPPDAYAAVAVEQRTSPLVACLVIWLPFYDAGPTRRSWQF